MAADCVVHAGPAKVLHHIDDLQKDVAPLPKAEKETPEQYENNINHAVALALTVFEKAGMYGVHPAIVERASDAASVV